jgi:ribosomal protein S27AE
VEPDPNERDHHACDGCGLVVDSLAALTCFRVELGHLEGLLQLCERCSPSGLAAYWMRDLEPHMVKQ